VTLAPAEPSPAPAAQIVPAVRAIGLGVEFDDRPVLRGIDLEVAQGQAVALLGVNGAGKSTLLRCLATLLPCTGRLFLFGARAAGQTAALRRRIGLIAHQSMLYRDLSPRENLVFFGRLYGLAAPACRADELLELVGLTARAGDPVRTLSRGMTQRVAIARAMMHQPDLLLADEPFEGLDAPSTQAVQSLLAHLAGQGHTVIFSSHDCRQALDLASRLLVLRKGRLAVDQPARGLSEPEVLKEITA